MSLVVDGTSAQDAPGERAGASRAPLVAGRFRLIEQLGRGGMGRVFRAHDEVLNRPVAVKLIYDDAVRDREVQHACALEARAAARLNHPGIVRILDSGFDDGHCYVVMSLAEGRTLAEIVREDGPLSLDRTLDLGIQIADALAAAHAEGVIHCDVKPGNLLVDADWRARLVDFGIARFTSSTTGLTGELLQGSAQYVAPEQVEGASVDGRTDLYALGTVLYELLVGKTPFGGGTIASILARRLVNDPPPLRTLDSRIPPHVERVILKALARDPAERFQTAAELRDALMTIRQSPVTDLSPGYDLGQTAPVRRRPHLRPAAIVRPSIAWTQMAHALVSALVQAATWAGSAGRQAGRRAGDVLPGTLAHARLLTPSYRPTLRTGVALAVVVGLTIGTVAAKCGVAGVAAETAIASDERVQARQQPAAPPEPLQAPAIEPVARVALPTATQTLPPTPVPPTATVPAPTPSAEPAIAEVPPAEREPAPAAQSGPAAPPPLRALTAAPPASGAPVQAAPPAASAEQSQADPPAPQPAPRSEEPESKPDDRKPRSDDDDDRRSDGDNRRSDDERRPLSNTPRGDDKTPEERQKQEQKRAESEKQAASPKPEPPKPEPAKPAESRKPEPKPEARKPDPPKQEPKKPEPKPESRGNGEKKKR